MAPKDDAYLPLMTTTAPLIAATQAWLALLGADAVVRDEAARQHAGSNISGTQRQLALILRPQRADEVAPIVRIAARFGIALYPVSSGRNWGYGCASPVRENCVLLDLSQLNRIIACDAELGVVTLEPGVTQQQLRDYLDQHQLPFMVPTTGAGPSTSLVGNALERGYGITPNADHFGAVTGLEAVLADGSHYGSALSELGGADVDLSHKWGLGPYLDGLFSQSNLGIVTRMSIALARRPQHTEAFFFWLRQDEDLEAAVVSIREIVTSCGALLGSVNLLNGYRMLSMTSAYPFDAVAKGQALAPELAQQQLQRQGFSAWTVMGAVYGDRPVVKAALARIRQHLQPLSRRRLSLTRRKLTLARRCLGWLPFGLARQRAQLESSWHAFNIIEGIPDEVAMRLVHWKSRAGVPDDLSQSMLRHERGLIWYAPLVPMRAADVRRYVQMVEQVCLAHGIEPLITLTSLSNRCFDSSVPLLFDLRDAAECARAQACYLALYQAGKAMGYLPYRMGVDNMHLLFGQRSHFFDLVRKIKSVMDPQGILAPGRYAPEAASAETAYAHAA